MIELVRCKPCGYVMPKNKLKNVCPACGMPHTAFEPYRETVSSTRKFILDLDMHPIIIHLSQTFVALIPLLIAFTSITQSFYYDELIAVINFSIIVLPFTLVLAIITGAIDGITRFKSLKPPLLLKKIVLSIIILASSVYMLIHFTPGEYDIITIVLSIICLICAVLLGLLGKKLLNVILPGKVNLFKIIKY